MRFNWRPLTHSPSSRPQAGGSGREPQPRVPSPGRQLPGQSSLCAHVLQALYSSLCLWFLSDSPPATLPPSHPFSSHPSPRVPRGESPKTPPRDGAVTSPAGFPERAGGRLPPGCPQAVPGLSPGSPSPAAGGAAELPAAHPPEALPGASGGSAEPPGAAPSRGSRSSGPGPGPWGGKGRRGRSEAAASLPGSAGGGSRRLAPTGRARPGPPGAARLGTARLSPLLLPLLPLQARPERHLEAAGSSQGETGHPALAPRAFLTSAPSCAAPGRATTARGDRQQHRALCCFPRWIRDLSLTTAFLREK